MPIVILAWATKKRHIAIDGKVLCEVKHKNSGYSVHNGQYNSIALHGLPDHPKQYDDDKLTHQDGIIEYAPLDQQKVKIITSSICNKCLERYNRIWQNKN